MRNHRFASLKIVCLYQITKETGLVSGVARQLRRNKYFNRGKVTRHSQRLKFRVYGTGWFKVSVAAGHGPLDGRLELVELESSRTTGELPVSCQCILLLYICADRDSELRISNGWHQAGWRCGDIDWLVTWSLLAEDRFEPAGGSPEFPGRRDHTTELPRQLVQNCADKMGSCILLLTN